MADRLRILDTEATPRKGVERPPWPRSPFRFWSNLAHAGTAGVEMAEMTRTALAEDFRHIDPRSAHILLFEAAPRTLLTDSVGRLHIYFLIGFANRQLVTLQWGVSFVTKRRGVRILPLAQAK